MYRTKRIPGKTTSLCRLLLLLTTCSLLSCESPKVEPPHKKANYIKAIPGKSDSVPASVAQAGEVLIAYSDCHTCHKENERSMGPAFRDIAKRYPVQPGYISLLGQKVILGGGGAWGKAIMLPHPNLSPKDAETMVSYILSLKENP